MIKLNKQSIGIQQSHAAPMSEINTTPLVDVMLVLLVIFIITAPLLTHAVRIDLPKANSQLIQEKPQIVNISIDGKENLYWNDQPIDKDSIKQKLIQQAQTNPQAEIHLRADKQTRYQLLAEIMAAAHQAGITKLGFVSQPE
jgi:biopolymer transport protein ExbD